MQLAQAAGRGEDFLDKFAADLSGGEAQIAALVRVLLLALAVIAGSAYAILRYDPQAFTLRSAESFEHRANAGGEPSVGEEEREHED